MIFNVSVIINCNYSKYLEKYWNIELSYALRFLKHQHFTQHGLVHCLINEINK